jgi:hypothetical protein
MMAEEIKVTTLYVYEPNKITRIIIILIIIIPLTTTASLTIPPFYMQRGQHMYRGE